MAKTNVYEMVTERIIAELEKGVIPWEKPWTGVRSGAYNRVSKRPYSPISTVITSSAGKIILLVFSVCGAIGVISVMEPFGATIGPPQERLYPVDPVGVEMMIPSAL